MTVLEDGSGRYPHDDQHPGIEPPFLNLSARAVLRLIGHGVVAVTVTTVVLCADTLRRCKKEMP